MLFRSRDNPAIWLQIEEFLKQDAKVCAIGDFNAIVSSTEKWGGNAALSNPNQAFRAWVSSSGLIDLGHVGSAYTWSNSQHGQANISERLDRGLATLAWTAQNKEAKVFHLPRFNSDHLPIIIRTNPRVTRQRPDFRCESWWDLREGFKEVCLMAAQKGGVRNGI